ncbi:unnamed protein product, partial [Ixodes hexagonus]
MTKLSRLVLISLLLPYVVVVGPVVVRQQQQTSLLEALQKLRRPNELQLGGDPANPRQVEPPVVEDEPEDLETLLRNRRQEREQAVMVQINVFNNDGKGCWHKKRKTPEAKNATTSSTSPDQDTTPGDGTSDNRLGDSNEDAAETSDSSSQHSTHPPCGDGAQKQDENQGVRDPEPPLELPPSDEKFPDYADLPVETPRRRQPSRFTALDDVFPDVQRRRARPPPMGLPPMGNQPTYYHPKIKPGSRLPAPMPDEPELNPSSYPKAPGRMRSPLLQQRLLRTPKPSPASTTACLCSTTSRSVTPRSRFSIFPWISARRVGVNRERQNSGRPWSQRERYPQNHAATYGQPPLDTEVTEPPLDDENYPVQEDDNPAQVRQSLSVVRGKSYNRRNSPDHPQSVARDPFAAFQLKGKSRSRVKREAQQAEQRGPPGWCPCDPSPRPKCKKTTHKRKPCKSRKPCTKTRRPCHKSKKPCRKATAPHGDGEEAARQVFFANMPPANLQ